LLKIKIIVNYLKQDELNKSCWNIYLWLCLVGGFLENPLLTSHNQTDICYGGCGLTELRYVGLERYINDNLL